MKAPHACLTGTATAQVADVVASSIEGDSDTFAANKLIDGDWDTRWSSDQSANAQTVVLDMNVHKSLASIELWW